MDKASPPRLITYVQTFSKPDGSPLSLLPLLKEKSGVTHIILAAFHINDEPKHITLNNDPPSSAIYDDLWSEVRILQQNGIKVLIMLGGAAKGSYERLNAVQFEQYYQPLLAILQKYSIDGLDLDIEENVPLTTPLRLLQRLNSDMGSDFLLTMAPVASALLPFPFDFNLSGFSYAQLDKVATDPVRPDGKLISWMNAQFYNGWGDAHFQIFYDAIILAGWSPTRVVLGVLADPSNGGSGFVSLRRLTSVVQQLRSNFPGFGGVFGWEYFNAGSTDGLLEPWQWIKNLGDTLSCPTTLVSNTTLDTLPSPVAPYPKEMAVLIQRGASYLQAVHALNTTKGDLQMAQANLFPLSHELGSEKKDLDSRSSM